MELLALGLDQYWQSLEGQLHQKEDHWFLVLQLQLDLRDRLLGPPFTSALLNSMSWSTVMMVLAIIVFATLLCLLAINPNKTNIDTGPKEKLGDALVNAAKDPTFSMLFLGFFFLWLSTWLYNCAFSCFYNRSMRYHTAKQPG